MKRKMTQLRANILNAFYAGASGRSDEFRHFKNASALAKYFNTMKQVQAYFFRVVFSETGRFTRSEPEQVLPADTIREIALQASFAGRIMKTLAMIDARYYDDTDTAKAVDRAFKSAVRQFYLSCLETTNYHLKQANTVIICH